MVPVAIATTAVLGEFRLLILHVPIGVLMVIGILQMASEVWRKEKAPQVEARKEEVPV
jgi:hypothetical protein